MTDECMTDESIIIRKRNKGINIPEKYMKVASCNARKSENW